MNVAIIKHSTCHFIRS